MYQRLDSNAKVDKLKNLAITNLLRAQTTFAVAEEPVLRTKGNKLPQLG